VLILALAYVHPFFAHHVYILGAWIDDDHNYVRDKVRLQIEHAHFRQSSKVGTTS
jgi:hypothetical protein